MAVEFKQFDPTAVVVTIAGITVFGYAEGTMVNVERNEDSYSLKVGAKGDGTRVRSRNKSGKITFNIMSESTCNDLLSAQVALDELTGQGYGPAMVKYVNGTTLCTAPNAWLVRPANVSYDTDPSPREWVIECHDLKMSLGGAVV